MTIKETIVARLLREYWNECEDEIQRLDLSADTTDEELSEALVDTDDKYAKKIMEALNE